MIPAFGTPHTKGWYGAYQCLVVFVPTIGTMTSPFRNVSSKRLVEEESVASVIPMGH
ncbi:MAG: hypothetical protein SPI30_00920 [Prevotella sp.]|nr:hypothetical protein [Prevotella sp.]